MYLDQSTIVFIFVVVVVVIGLILTGVYYFARYSIRTHEEDREVFKKDAEVTQLTQTPQDIFVPSLTRTPEPAPAKVPSAEAPPKTPSAPAPVKRKTLQEALEGTKASFWGKVKFAISGKDTLSPSDIDSLEEVLFTSDLGPATAQVLFERVGDSLKANEKSDLNRVKEALKSEIQNIFAETPGEDLFGNLQVQLREQRPLVWMVVGVNGVGKTTTIGKLAAKARERGLKTMIVAGDTFRAAADAQLKTWAERAGAEYYSTEMTKDPGAVAYQGLEKARGQGMDLVIVDTAGRLHTQENLMEELKKMKRVMTKVIATAPHRTLLVIDANSGQNALEQARQFHKALEVSDVVITKMDGTSKGGVAVGLVHELKIPIGFIGVGEGVEDLRPFSAQEFVDAIL